MQQISQIIKSNNWKQAEAAEHYGLPLPRINDLLHCLVSNFSLNAMVIAVALGQRLHVTLGAA
jgi:predicted XRE-type DNA-binding protein